MKKYFALLLALTFILLLSWYARKISVKDVPDDFNFSLEWGGDSTYDSRTGKLVKQKIATHVDDYTTTYFLTNEQKSIIYNLILKMDPETYPDEYNPIRGMTKPSRNIILKVTYNGKKKTITCNNVSLEDSPDGVKGKNFMKVHDAIVKFITASDEWLSLPNYEFNYH